MTLPVQLCFNHRVEPDVYIGLGSNMGDRELNLLRAVAELGKIPDFRITALSPFYETSPVGNVEQESFYNAVVRASTGLEPGELLPHLLRIETDCFKRTRTVLHGPRRMDLDLLLFGTRIVNGAELVLPHPRLAERRFVLRPLCDIAPLLVHPVIGRTITGLLDSLESSETVVRI